MRPLPPSCISWLVAFASLACGGPPTPPPAPPVAAVNAPPAEDELVAEEAPEAAPTSEGAADPLRAAVESSDRPEADRALDEGRKPLELLRFLGVRSGWRVADLGAGGGYTTELLARAVGPSGVVYAQNSKYILERFAEKPLTERLARPAMSHVKRVDREFDSPLPPEVTGLDLVVNVLFYHDTVWMKVDREKMNRAIFQALRPGGFYAIVDHAAKPGRGVEDVKTLHRIEESVVRVEVEKAGFRFDSESAFLASPDDARDWNASPGAAAEKRGTSHRFAVRFVKPAQ